MAYKNSSLDTPSLEVLFIQTVPSRHSPHTSAQFLVPEHKILDTPASVRQILVLNVASPTRQLRPALLGGFPPFEGAALLSLFIKLNNPCHLMFCYCS